MLDIWNSQVTIITHVLQCWLVTNNWLFAMFSNFNNNYNHKLVFQLNLCSTTSQAMALLGFESFQRFACCMLEKDWESGHTTSDHIGSFNTCLFCQVRYMYNVFWTSQCTIIYTCTMCVVSFMLFRKCSCLYLPSPSLSPISLPLPHRHSPCGSPSPHV